MNIPYVFKRCTKCGEWLVASTYNFNKMKNGKYGLQPKCNTCRKEYRNANKEKISLQNKAYRENNKEHLKKIAKIYYEENKDKISERGKKYREINKDKISEREKKYREANKEKKLEYGKTYYNLNKERIAKYQKEYRKNNNNKVAEYQKKYREANKERISEYHKQYYEKNKEKLLISFKNYNELNKEKIKIQRKKRYKLNKEKILEYHKQYYKTPQGQTCQFNASSRRRLREENQGNGITPEQWLECMKFFDFKCAYSGKYIGGESEHRTIDHIYPISKGGEHEIWNVVPMYDSYNYSKHNKEFLEWYNEQTFFSEERLQKIYEWQEYAYNKWHKNEIVK